MAGERILMQMTTAIGPESCGWCGVIHTGRCPLVRAIEYYPNGTIKRIEFQSGGVPTTIKIEPVAVPLGGWPVTVVGDAFTVKV